MFVAHYAPALALKAVRNSPSLAAGFLAVQLVDVGFFALTAVGIEKWAPNPDLQGFQKIDLYFMPYTHSLLGSALWALAAACVVGWLSPRGAKAAAGLMTGFLVLSHWFLDLIVHRHDLPLVSDSDEKLGYGLWDYPLIEAPLELGLLAAGFAVYLAVSSPKGPVGRAAPWIVAGVLVVLQGINWFGGQSEDVMTVAVMGLAAYGLVVLLGLWLDRVRA